MFLSDKPWYIWIYFAFKEGCSSVCCLFVSDSFVLVLFMFWVVLWGYSGWFLICRTHGLWRTRASWEYWVWHHKAHHSKYVRWYELAPGRKMSVIIFFMFSYMLVWHMLCCWSWDLLRLYKDRFGLDLGLVYGFKQHRSLTSSRVRW